MEYLFTLARGGPITDLAYNYCPFGWEFPNLDIKLTNNSGKALFFQAAEFQIGQSSTNREPVLVLPADSYFSNARHFHITNEGWGNVRSCVIRYNVRHGPSGEADAHLDHRSRFGPPYKYQQNVGTFAESINVNVADALAAEGANLAALDSLEMVEQRGEHIRTARGEVLSEKEHERRLARALGPFRNNVAVLFGQMQYSGDTESGAFKDHTLSFSCSVHLYNEFLAGAPAPPTYQYNARLETDKSNYSVSVPISQALKAGETDRFNIRVGALKSSTHTLRFKLNYNNNQTLESQPITLRLFVPRSAEGMLATSVVPRRTARHNGTPTTNSDDFEVHP